MKLPSKSIPEVEKLIRAGEAKGYLTQEEMQQHLPAGVLSREQMDDVVSLLAQRDIDIVESSREVKRNIQEDVDHAEKVRHEHDGEEKALEAAFRWKTNDVARSSDREMGTMKSTEREGEVVGAGRREDAERPVLEEAQCATIIFVDRSREREQGDLRIEVPGEFKQSIDRLILKLSRHGKCYGPVTANMGAYLHLRHYDGGSKYLLGWKKTSVLSKYPGQMEKYFYVNRHALEKLGLTVSDSFAGVKRFLAEGGFDVSRSKEHRDNLSLLDVDLSVQARIIDYIAAKLP